MRLYWPLDLRPSFDALFAIDDALGAVVASTTQPALGAIRLAWWRDALERLDTAPPPAEPRLGTAATELLPRGVSGAMLARLVEGWSAYLHETIDPDAIAVRGEALFAAGAHLLGAHDARIPEAGRLYALGNSPRHGLSIDPASPIKSLRFDRRLRPLTGLAQLAVRDLKRGQPGEPEATPGRAWALLRHRFTGTVG